MMRMEKNTIVTTAQTMNRAVRIRRAANLSMTLHSVRYRRTSVRPVADGLLRPRLGRQVGGGQPPAEHLVPATFALVGLLRPQFALADLARGRSREIL